MVVQFIINGIILGSIFASLALGFSLVYYTTKIFHIAYAVLYMISGYFLYTFFNHLHYPYIVAVILSIITTIIVSLLIEFLVYKPLDKKKASFEVLLISSLGAMTIVINLIALFYGNETKVIDNNIAKSISLGEIIITYPQIYEITFSVLFIVLFFILVHFTRLGIVIRAYKDDAELVKVHGLNIYKTRMILFALSGFFAALSGILMAQDIGMDPYIGLPMILNVFVAMIIGGTGKFSAPVLGGFIIGLLQALVVWQFSANWQEAITFLLLIGFLIFRPQGILGKKIRAV